MTYREIQDTLMLKLKEAQQEKILYDIVFRNEDLCRGGNEFLFFIKPELTVHSENIRYSDIIKLIFDKIHEFNFIIHDIRIITAPYLAGYNIIAQHYGVINKLSQKPLNYISDEAVSKFKELFGVHIKEINLQGSLEFLQNNPDVNAETLESWCQKSKIEKLAGGTYVNELYFKGEKVYVINGFHPRQIDHFTAKGKSIIAFTLTSNTSWKAARNNFIGKTNPADASPGSIRNELLVNKERFGLSAVSSSANGVHLSAGPVEGLVELVRYNSDFSKNDTRTYKDFTFGLKLAESFSEKKIAEIFSNTKVTYNGKSTPVFDLTEEMDSSEAIEVLKEVVQTYQ